MNRPPLHRYRSDLRWYGVDLDGTLSSPLWTPENPTAEIGDPILENVEKLHEVVKAGFKIVIHTSRPWTDHENVATWLEYWGIPYREIQMGKPLYRAYVDDRAIPADAESWLP